LRAQEARQAKLERAEGRVRAHLFELVELQLAAAARVRGENRALAARLAVATKRAAALEHDLSGTPLGLPPSRLPTRSHVHRQPCLSGESAHASSAHEREREVEINRRLLLLDLRRQDFEEREACLALQEAGLDEQRAALSRVLALLPDAAKASDGGGSASRLAQLAAVRELGALSRTDGRQGSASPPALLKPANGARGSGRGRVVRPAGAEGEARGAAAREGRQASGSAL